MLKNKIKIILRIIPLIIIASLILWYFIAKPDFSAQTIVGYTPQNTILAILFILFLYAVKSIIIFFPLAALYIAGGLIFPIPIAIIISLIGSIIDMCLPYVIGIYLGADYTQKLLSKYPKVKKIFELQQKNEWFLCYFLRIVNCLPGDIISMYLGSVKTPFFRYFIGSMSGIIPGIISTTLIGSSITDMRSPMFVFSVSFTAILSIISALTYYFYTKKIRKKDQEQNEK